MRVRPHPRGRDGFSLIELLLAMSLFAVLSVGLIAMLAKAGDFLTGGASQTETLDALQTYAEKFGDDVAAVASRPDCETGMPAVRLYCDFAPCDLDGDKRADVDALQRLFFVRTLGNDASDPVLRSGGQKVGAKEYVDQVDDLAKAKDAKLRASGGLMEVFWTALPESKADPAVMQLWRGYSAPPGRPGFVPVKWWQDRGATALEKGPLDATDIRAVAKPVLSGVLYFGVEFWGRTTTTWDSQVRPRDGGPMTTWDSTRGILPQAEDRTGFWLSRRDSGGASSVDDPTDDTFPRKMRVTCVVEELGRNARVGYLADDLPADAKTFVVNDASFFPATETTRRYVKIDQEWLQVETPSGRTFQVVQRGARGTTAVRHDANSRVHHGRTMVVDYDVATFRDSYADLPALTGRGFFGK